MTPLPHIHGNVGGNDAYTVALLHFDGSDASTTFTDSCRTPHTFSAVGNAQLDTAQLKFGSASLLLDGTGDNITAPDSDDWSFGTGDWTIDFFVRFASLAGAQIFATHGYQLLGDRSWQIYWNNTGTTLRIAQSNDGTASSDQGVSWSPSIDTWYHIAYVRTGAAIKVFADGIQQGADLTAVDVFASGQLLSLGVETVSYFNGWLDEFRITKGFARWTAAFTPPSVPYW